MYAKLRESPSSTETSESRKATREKEAGKKGPESVSVAKHAAGASIVPSSLVASNRYDHLELT